MKIPALDPTNCDREPIHIPGKIQAHGFLLALRIIDFTITHISENIKPYIKNSPKEYLGKHIELLENDLMINNAALLPKFSDLLKFDDTGKTLNVINPIFLKVNDEPFNLIIVLSDDLIIMEFETADTANNLDIPKAVGQSVSEILSGNDSITLFKNAAREIKKLINYDRVMIYRFDEDGHGEIIAEEKNDNLEPFLGLHYPASDVPVQARELYKLNLTRIIADANSVNSPILAIDEYQPPLNLSLCTLRAVSPMHIQYMKNMGVASSFSISLIAKGELWGLVACHSYSPKFIDYKAREASKLISRILSSALVYLKGEEESEKFTILNEDINCLVNVMDKGTEISSALTKGTDITILNITNATGAVLVFNNEITTLGITPDKKQLDEIIAWLFENIEDSVFYTNKFPLLFEGAKKYANIASGVLACRLSKELRELIIWFKPEQIESVNWAGNPKKFAKQDANGIMQFTPRRSFEKWAELTMYTSEKWSRAEIASVIRIREHIIYAVSRKASEIRMLNDKLKIAYDELDTFSHTVSHDLRTPLSSIKGYSEILLMNNESLDDNAKRLLERIVTCSDKMAFLITEILNYSSIGRNGIFSTNINMTKLIQEIKTDLLSDFKLDNAEFTISDTPDIEGDSVMIGQVFTNLLSNAIKYTSKVEHAKIVINGYKTNKEVIYSVTDNGIGIDINYYNQVFQLFKRSDNVKEYDGIGVGLSIVKRIIEKHDGRIWFDSILGSGTTFYVALKLKN